MRRLGDFKETSKKVEFTTKGWDGKGYHGEGQRKNIWKREGDENVYVCMYRKEYHAYCLLKIDFNNRAKETYLPISDFYCDFEKEQMEH